MILPQIRKFLFYDVVASLVFLPRMLELFLGFCASLGFATDAQIFTILCGALLGFFATNARIVFGVLRFAWVCHRCTDFLMYYVVASHGVFQDFRLLTFDFIMWSLCLVFLSRMHELFLGFCASLGFATDAQIFNVLGLSLRLGVFRTFAFCLFCASLGFFATDAQILVCYVGRFAWGFSGLLPFLFVTTGRAVAKLTPLFLTCPD